MLKKTNKIIQIGESEIWFPYYNFKFLLSLKGVGSFQIETNFQNNKNSKKKQQNAISAESKQINCTKAIKQEYEMYAHAKNHLTSCRYIDI
uniref:CSON009722 protein n=1 Tax=Culicoides sonorensis TaxID=179676 RepID=A0A336KAH0_CULSO